MGPWTTRLSSSHLPGALPTPLAFLSGRERKEGKRKRGRGRSRRGPTGPVSSRAFLELILFVGCQPVAAQSGQGEESRGRRMRRDEERERERSCAAMGPGSDPDPTAPNGN